MTRAMRKIHEISGAVYFYSGGDWHLHEVWVNGKEMYR